MVHFEVFFFFGGGGGGSTYKAKPRAYEHICMPCQLTFPAGLLDRGGRGRGAAILYTKLSGGWKLQTVFSMFVGVNRTVALRDLVFLVLRYLSAETIGVLTVTNYSIKLHMLCILYGCIKKEDWDQILFSFSTDKDRRTDSRIRRKNTAQPRSLCFFFWSGCQFFYLCQCWKRREFDRNDPDKSEFTIEDWDISEKAWTAASFPHASWLNLFVFWKAGLLDLDHAIPVDLKRRKFQKVFIFWKFCMHLHSMCLGPRRGSGKWSRAVRSLAWPATFVCRPHCDWSDRLLRTPAEWASKAMFMFFKKKLGWGWEGEKKTPLSEKLATVQSLAIPKLMY